LREELNYDIADLRCQHSSAFLQLNQCRLNVYNCVLKAVLEKRQELIFVQGHGGTGKTFLWHKIINRLRSDGLIVIVVASSGIASLLLPGGHTTHSRFKIPLTVSDTSSCKIKKKRDLARLLEMTSLIVCDEAPMNNQCCFEALDRSLCDILTNGNELPNDIVCKASSDDENADILYPVEVINQLEFNGVSSHTISLRIGTPIMLLRNLNLSAGLCNGTRLIVTQLAERVIEAQIITGSFIDNQVCIPRILFPINDTKCSFTIKRKQFPMRPCYVMTINKSQGQSLKIVGVFLKKQVLTHGQLYIALSRVTSKEGLKIITCDAEGNHSIYTKNIMYKDVLCSLSMS